MGGGDVILGVGTDIVQVSRIARVVEGRGEAFLDRVYTPGELQYAGDGKDRDRRLAGRWAAKEAVRKTLRGELSRVAWRDVEVFSGPAGEPSVRLRGEAARAMEVLGGTDVHLSLSHSGDVAIAVALLVARSATRCGGGSPGRGR